MEVQDYTGVLAQIIAAINEAGSPPKTRRIQVTEEEMLEIFNSQAFRTSISNYYGATTAMTLEGITTAIDGKIMSMYLGGICIAVGPFVPSGALGDVGYEPLVATGKGEITFVIEGDDGKQYMLSGIGNPADDFVIGKNSDIEMGLAIRKYNDATYYGDGAGAFDIELDTLENWTFAVSVGSLNPDVPNVTDMYDISLMIDVDPTATENALKWDLQLAYNGTAKNYVWYNSGSRVVADSATNGDLSVTQMIQQYAFRHISDYIPSTVERNKAGSPLGEFSIVLVATPKFGSGEPVLVEATAFVTKKS
jgi:hypothetical protein